MRLLGIGLAALLAGCQPPQPRLEGTSLSLTPASGAASPAGTATPGASTIPVGTPAGGATAAPPAATAQASPVAGGNSAGGAPGGLMGRVLEADATADVPIASAVVTTTDGGSATTDAAGRFTLPGGLPADGTLAARAAGHVGSVVVGLGAGAIALHLEPAPGFDASPGESPFGARPFQATGRVQDAAGQPVADVMVTLADGRGAYCTPAISSADGSFTLDVSAIDRTVQNGSVLAVGLDGQHVFGLASLASLAPAAATIPPITVTRASHAVQVAVDASAVNNPATTSLTVEGTDGETIQLAGGADGFVLADVPGVSFVLRVESDVTDADGWASLFQQALSADAPSPVTATLLAPPGPPRVTAGSLAWDGVAGAAGYRLALDDLAGHVALWDAFTAGTSFAFPGIGAGAGPFGLVIDAFDEEGLDARSVAAWEPRALRRLPLSRRFRRSTRTAAVTF